MIDRPQAMQRLKEALSRSSAVALVGPRQCGKTTLSRMFVSPDSINYFDLEDPISLARLDEPMTALADLQELVVIDEIQRRPDLFPILRVLIDRERKAGQYLILGSASMELLKQSSESLAGRLETIELSGFSLAEVGGKQLQRHWLSGGFPLSFLAESEEDSFIWRKNLVNTFVQRDIPEFGFKIPQATMLRFWSMIAHYHGQLWNAQEMANAISVSQSSCRRYLDLLEDLLMVRQLKPWHANISKRQVKSPKIYLRDSGLLHYLLGIKSMKELLEHPKNGASWEGYAIEEILKTVTIDDCYFWATHGGAELDLLLIKDGRRFGVELKRKDAPRITPSMKAALADLQLEKLSVIYPGTKPYKLSSEIQVLPLGSLASESVSTLV